MHEQWKNDQYGRILNKIYYIPRAVKYAKLAYTFAYRSNVTKVTHLHPVYTNLDARLGSTVFKASKSFSEKRCFTDFYHMITIVNILTLSTMVYSNGVVPSNAALTGVVMVAAVLRVFLTKQVTVLRSPC